jgi:RHS repeat-associated protein
MASDSNDGAWTVSFYGYDGGGNVRQLTNSAGAVTDEYEYDAYGNSFTKVGTTPNNYLYRGEQFDSDLGLYYLRARYYNPNTGRFMSRDPDDHSLFSPNDLHKYLYANGDPVNTVDPSGRGDYGITVWAALKIGAAAIQIPGRILTAWCLVMTWQDIAGTSVYANDLEKQVKNVFCATAGSIMLLSWAVLAL